MGNTKKMYEEMNLQEMIEQMFKMENADDDYQFELYRDQRNEMLERDMNEFFNSFHNGN